jgi:hypothetical protein
MVLKIIVFVLNSNPSITPSFSHDSTREVAMNGIHWGEIYKDPFDISDTTLAAESFRLLATKIKNSVIYPIDLVNEKSKYRNYLMTKQDNSSLYYLSAVNDKDEPVNLIVDMRQLKNFSLSSYILVEQVGDVYLTEWMKLDSTRMFNVTLNQYTTMRLAIQTGGKQRQALTQHLYMCTLNAGFKSNLNRCNENLTWAGTSNTTNHENTSVSLIRFSLNSSVNFNAKLTILKLNIQAINILSDVKLTILGVSNFTWNESEITWNKLAASGPSILRKLDSGQVIDSVSKNFIDWTSPSDLTIAGHVNASPDNQIQERMIDVSDHVAKMVGRNLTNVTFLIYRPFRHPAYTTGYGSLRADDLSNGSLVQISNPQLVQLF